MSTRIIQSPAVPSAEALATLASVELVSVEYASDHHVLKDHDTSWNDGGTLYGKPDWTSSGAHPVTHTMDQPVVARVRIKPKLVDGELEARLRGEGPNGIQFESPITKLQDGVEVEIKVASKQKLPKKVYELEFAVNWSVRPADAPPVATSPSQSKNTFFVTHGTPTTPAADNGRQARPGITLKRMRHAVNATSSASKMEPHPIALHILDSASYSNSTEYINEWQLADNLSSGADCFTIVRYTQCICDMIGLPGTRKIVVVWAKVATPATPEENPAKTPNMIDPPQMHPTRSDARAWLIEKSGAPNKFEACMVYTHVDKYYYAGGMGRFKTSTQVLRQFARMSYVEDSTGTEVPPPIYVYGP